MASKLNNTQFKHNFACNSLVEQYSLIFAFCSAFVICLCWRLSPIDFNKIDAIHFVLFFIACFVICLFPVRISSEGINFLTTVPLGVAAAYLYGPFIAVVMVALSSILSVASLLWKTLDSAVSFRRIIWNCIYNVPCTIISTGIPFIIYQACLVMHFFFSESPIAIFALSIVSISIFYINAIMTTTLVSMSKNIRWDIVWYHNYRWTFTSTLLLSPLGFLMGALTQQSIWLGLAFISLPIIALRQGYALHERRLTTYRAGIQLLGRLMQESHPYTHAHLSRVARWAVKIAEDLKLPAISMSHIENAAVLHDIGKIAIDDRILNKPGALTESEWEQIKRHPVIGAQIVSRMKYLDSVALWINYHHERIDGKGYPNGLNGSGIPIESKIICVVDAFDAMVGGPLKADQRPYRQPKTLTEARAELVQCSNTQFDEVVVNSFLKVLDSEDLETDIISDDPIKKVELHLLPLPEQPKSQLNSYPREPNLRGAA